MSLVTENYEKGLRWIRESEMFYNPLYAWITLIWCASKVVQWILFRETTVWEDSWNWFLDNYGEDEFQLIVHATGVLSTFIVIFISALYLFMDTTLKPESLRKYKVQLHTNEPVDRRKFAKAILLIIFNNIFVTIPFMFLYYRLLSWRGIPTIRNLESFHTTMLNIYMCLIAYEINFYFSHYKWFYKHVHKVHHEWTASIAIIALYSHPFEHLLSNLGSVFIGIFLTGCHIATGWMWLTLLLISTLSDHSGYHIPFLHSSEFHDYHHLKFTVNYGAMGFTDRLFGTDRIFRGTVNEIRNRTLLSLRSARERFPDPQMKKQE